MLSTPPAIYSSPSPQMIALAASITACSPEAQSRLTVLPATVSGKPAGSLSGGNDYIFAKSDTPAQIEAGIKWVDFEDYTPGVGQFNFTRQKADGVPVGFPEPTLFTGAVESQINQLRSASSTINIAYYQPYINANEASDGEPIDAQAVYKSLDPTMLAVLTEANANIPALLKQAATNVNSVLTFATG